MTNGLRRELYNKVSDLLDDWSMDDLLEALDVTKEDTLLTLYDAGLLDGEYFAELLGISIETLEGE